MRHLLFCGTFSACMCLLLGGCGSSSGTSTEPSTDNSGKTQTPIKHVVVIIGENRSFDNLFATYTPGSYQGQPQTVFNMLSEGIIQADGTAGPNYTKAVQNQAMDFPADQFQLSPAKATPAAYSSLPQPNCGWNILSAPYNQAYKVPVAADPGLAPADEYLMSTGGYAPCYPSGIVVPVGIKDARLEGVTSQTPIPFDATNYGGITTADTLGDPVHRFYQMWQQSDCNVANATADNPSGCAHDLYPWVGVTVGWAVGDVVEDPPDWLTFQGSVSLEFYNMAKGDLPYLQQLAAASAMSDNYHQFIMGGTGPNSISIGTAAPLVYSDANGNPAVPPAASNGRSQIEDPNADPKYANNNNYYANDGFPLANSGNASNAAYTNCSDTSQPGVAAIMNYLHSLPYTTFHDGNCAPGTYYLLNDDLPTYQRDGSPQSAANQQWTVGPSSVPTMGDALSAAHVTWRYYGEGFSEVSGVYAHYCEICNPFQYAKSIMTTDLKSNFKDLYNFYSDLENNTLPAVSYIKPDDITDGHPGTSAPAMFEAFTKNMVQQIQSSKAWDSTAIIITMDESGGLYDSGYIQPIDYFGDGPRIPLIIVSKYAKQGYVDHTYNDHASISKFIEYNWGLKPLSGTSRDNLPNPTAGATPYVPGNSPAVGDLTTLFDFNQ